MTQVEYIPPAEAVFPRVKEQTLFYNHGGATRRPDNHRALIDPDTGDMYAIVTDRYKLVKFEDSVGMVEDAVESLPEFGRSTRSITFPKPGRMLATWTFTDAAVDIDGHSVEPQIILRRSYDTTWEFWLLCGAFRFICMNGMVTGEKVLDFRHKHTGGIITTDLKGALENTMGRFYLQTSEWKKWAERPTTFDEYENVMEVMGFGKTHMAAIGDEVEISSDICLEDIKTRTLNYWIFFQILSQYITHKVKSQLRQQHFHDRMRRAFYGGGA